MRTQVPVGNKMTDDNLDLKRELLKLDIAKQKAEMQIDSRKWIHRRTMAYMALISILMVTLALFTVVPESKMAPLGDISTIFYFAMMGILGAYFGTASFQDIKLPPKR